MCCCGPCPWALINLVSLAAGIIPKTRLPLNRESGFHGAIRLSTKPVSRFPVLNSSYRRVLFFVRSAFVERQYRRTKAIQARNTQGYFVPRCCLGTDINFVPTRSSSCVCADLPTAGRCSRWAKTDSKEHRPQDPICLYPTLEGLGLEGDVSGDHGLRRFTARGRAPEEGGGLFSEA